MTGILMIGLVIFGLAFVILIVTAVSSQNRHRREMERLEGNAEDQRRLLERQEALLDRVERLLDRVEKRVAAEPIDDSIRARG
jgi:uncharacterized protein YoxC